MAMPVNSVDVMSGLAEAGIKKLMDSRTSLKSALKDGAIVGIESALARAWTNSALASSMIPDKYKDYVYIAILNVLYSWVIEKKKMDSEDIAVESIEPIAARMIGEWLAMSLKLTW